MRTWLLSSILLSIVLLFCLPYEVHAQIDAVEKAILETFNAYNTEDSLAFAAQFHAEAKAFDLIGSALVAYQEPNWSFCDYRFTPNRIRVQVEGAMAFATAYVSGNLTCGQFRYGGPWRYTEVRSLEGLQWKIVHQHFSLMHEPMRAVADAAYDFPVADPAYPENTGPTVWIDEAHFNLHTAWGRYQPFADLLRKDGYVVEASSQAFERGMLEEVDILVIVNAMSENLVGNQGAEPETAFTSEEIEAVHEWVEAGGALFLITDHNPYPVSSHALAARFGIHFQNCGAVNANSGWLIFRRTSLTPPDKPTYWGADSISYGTGGEVLPHPLTAGIDSIATFLGSAFQIDNPHGALLRFEGAACYGDVDVVIPDISGYLQGAVMEYGDGRIAVFGDDAMFTAERTRWGSRRGMNNEIASQNPLLLLNIFHWLSNGKQR